MTILLLAGSPSTPSRSTRLLHHAGERLAARGNSTVRLHVPDLPAEALLRADFSHPGIRRAQETVAAAEAIVVATPVYKAAYSGILKAFLDLLPQDGLAGKLVLPLATGGSQSHMLALDYALRPVLTALAARHVLPSVYATDAQVEWNPQQGLLIAEPILKRIDSGIEQLSANLAALRAAREEAYAPVPFSQVRCSV